MLGMLFNHQLSASPLHTHTHTQTHTRTNTQSLIQTHTVSHTHTHTNKHSLSCTRTPFHAITHNPPPHTQPLTHRDTFMFAGTCGAMEVLISPAGCPLTAERGATFLSVRGGYPMYPPPRRFSDNAGGGGNYLSSNRSAGLHSSALAFQLQC